MLTSVVLAVYSLTVCPQTFMVLFVPLSMLVFFLSALEYVFVWKLCEDILRGKHRFVGGRVRRESSSGSIEMGGGVGEAGGEEVEVLRREVTELKKMVQQLTATRATVTNPIQL